MPIHEKSLIRPENLTTHDELVIDGVDVSGHWSTFIESRVVSDYNENLEDEIAALKDQIVTHEVLNKGLLAHERGGRPVQLFLAEIIGAPGIVHAAQHAIGVDQAFRG